jgi:hypothetical protein
MMLGVRELRKSVSGGVNYRLITDKLQIEKMPKNR